MLRLSVSGAATLLSDVVDVGVSDADVSDADVSDADVSDAGVFLIGGVGIFEVPFLDQQIKSRESNV